MVRIKLKWKLPFFLYLILINVFTKSLPVDRTTSSFVSSETSYGSINSADVVIDHEAIKVASLAFEGIGTVDNTNDGVNRTEDQTPFLEEIALAENNSTKNLTFNSPMTRQDLRPGQEVRQYNIELTFDGDRFIGRAVLDVILTTDTRDDDIELHCDGLTITSVLVGVFTEASAIGADSVLDGDILIITPARVSSTYVVIIEYTGTLGIGHDGLYQSNFYDTPFLAMNLHPTNARRVFPCMDEPTEAATISFTIRDLQYNNIIFNSQLQDGSTTEYEALQGPPHLWGLVAHSFTNTFLPAANVFLYARQGVSNQESMASLAISHYYNALNEWTNKPYTEIIVNQEGRMHIMATPDISTEWVALSSVCIWEPYVLMETSHSVKQRKTALVKIAEAMSRQWFGYVIHPENWRHQWVISGLGTYAAYEVLRSFQDNPSGNDITLLDVNTLFVTDVIQESLLRDAHSHAQVLETSDNLFDPFVVRDHINGLLRYKAPALMRMFRLILGEEDHIQNTARTLLNRRALQTVSSDNFYEALSSEIDDEVENIEDMINPWVLTTGYPLVHVGIRQGGVILTQEHFSFTPQTKDAFSVPINYATSLDPNFGDDQIYPFFMMEATMSINIALGEEDWIVFNIQGQGYYRVNYDGDLWERLIEALDDPGSRTEIHPLNRATLVDDSLNLARAGKLNYETAFLVALTLEHEREYAVWKAFIRNMDFIRKRLVALVDDDDDLDPDIYLRMVRRTIGMVENELTFYPDPNINEPAMDSLTRGLVMDHACRANYQPCIAAAIDWFYDPDSNEPRVNPNIPHEIRPAVYCTMIREGDQEARNALFDRLEIENVLYERVVILESLACSQDEGFIRSYLEETIAVNSPYSVEERSKIFIAVAESSYQNANLAVNFLTLRSMLIRERYGGLEKFEEIIFALVENMADYNLYFDFTIFLNFGTSNLDDFESVTERARGILEENQAWIDDNILNIYEWIDENDAPTIFVSFILISISLLISLFNH